MSDTEKKVRAALAEKDLAFAMKKRNECKLQLERVALALAKAERQVEIASAELREARDAVGMPVAQ